MSFVFKKINERCPELILLDIVLPKMDGFEVLKKLKDSGIEVKIDSNPSYMHNKFAIIDEKIVREIIPKLKQAGAQGIIEYPLNKIVD